MSSLREKITTGEFTITCEVGPPKGTRVEKELEEIEEIAHLVDAFNVTDLQSSVLRLGSLAVSHLIEERGHEAVYQLTCRDRNRLALQSDLLSAWTLGCKNVLALTGDHTTLGDHPQAKPVFDLDSTQLLEVIKALNSGVDMEGNELEGSTDFFAGASINPVTGHRKPQIAKATVKAQRGARFFQSQAVYDPEVFREFMGELREAGVNTPVLIGILPLKSAGMARFMNDNIAGVIIPDSIIEELADAEDTVLKSIEICARIIDQTEDICQGIHLMPMGWEKHIPKILEEVDSPLQIK